MNNELLSPVHVIGAGLAGSEAAWQLAQAKIPVILHEMKPLKKSSAHHSDNFAELVCSNSFRAANIENAVGLLKEELRQLNSLVIAAADKFSVPAGGALAVDREKFSSFITQQLSDHPLIKIVHEEVTDIMSLDGPIIIASGPLTSEALAENIKKIVNQEYLYFYDAAAPIVASDSLNLNTIFAASRYNKGDADYLNCPFTKEQYLLFWQELKNAETVQIKEFEKEVFFEACMPIEEMANRGEDTMRFGPMKPVGLTNPRTGEDYYAVVQLRRDNAVGSLYNIVGFQTHLTWGEQKRVFSLIPGLENAEFVRYGVMHRNTYINSPKLLGENFCLKELPHIHFAGQITGVEGYVESVASGLLAALSVVKKSLGCKEIIFPQETACGALAFYVQNAAADNFQPMNINYGIIKPLEVRVRKKKEKNLLIAEKSLKIINAINL
ncbi:MAG TPA: methylenetetrahydrofolate--tRNA-(uracil(54)-C(5))-methyltransferase (FADH(2)-oxidizing) TrmFO [Candidatus Avacidaminococcus intestinavium]|uniref:Methylenetetrahydrofolate--tRNA-(uracil-5-)-methyltransferase TrmFO n=1 Tax=Candidatus Avacidaminococcus intestinavium TaxID=2840684 RepID=A0A9D1SLK2_9FIRM|nr:methylenetetrahydrofolate--tRNA-(uracil(54)-C(5))-methyltransferase (FADH(2)-oxidizing) TrmFO [Candidatus Avacidaminococcus intestinavium]